MNTDVFANWPAPSEPSAVLSLRQSLQLDRCRETPLPHQVTGVSTLLANPFFGLFDDMGLGKTMQTIITAMLLFERGLIDRVIVIAPATIRSVWFDQDLGELAKHLFVPSLISEYHQRVRQWRYLAGDDSRRLRWIITNYDFIRREERCEHLLKYCGPRTFAVFDESSALKNRTAQQTKACYRIRFACGRMLLLNGTPIPHSPLDLFSQGNIMDPRILECKSFFQFRSRYAIMRPNSSFPQIIGWQNLEDLQRRFKPYVLRRLKTELDLPLKLPAVPHEVRLSTKTWEHYKQMRDDLVTWLDAQHVSVSPHVVTKIMRLSQITSGFIGGVEEEPNDEWFDTDELPVEVERKSSAEREISREKIEYVFFLLRDLFDKDPTLKVLVWFRFRFEYARAMALARERLQPHVIVTGVTGKQRKAERKDAERLLDPRTAPRGNVVAFMTAGHKGLNLTAASLNIYCSHDRSLDKRSQSEDRTHRFGQVRSVSNIDVVAYGPDGQKTLDHTILKARKEQLDVANFTTDAWISALTAE